MGVMNGVQKGQELSDLLGGGLRVRNKKKCVELIKFN